MSCSIPIKVGMVEFSSKTAAKAFVKTLVSRYDIGELLIADDKVFCLALFKLHSEYPAKLHPWVSEIQIKVQDQGTIGFQIYKIDGTDDDISWHHCVDHAGGY